MQPWLDNGQQSNALLLYRTMNILCKRVHLLDRDPDSNLDRDPENFALCNMTGYYFYLWTNVNEQISGYDSKH